MIAEHYELAARRPLAFGGWEFVITGPDLAEKRVEWWPSDPHLSWEGRPLRAAPLEQDSAKGARAAAEALVARLNADVAA